VAKLEAVKRRKEVAAARGKQQKFLDKGNSDRLKAAKKQKGTQRYDYQSIQGQSDFGAGKAGPGIPWSVKHAKVNEKSKPPKQSQLPDWIGGRPSKVNRDRLWPIGNMSAPQATDWKLQAIRRRLGNG
jgi:hypothetical protein